jgi:predicted GNAT family acetyltransferase
MKYQVKHDQKYQQFIINLGEDDAELAYSLPKPDVLDFTHSYVPENQRGKGLAEKLTQFALDYAAKNGKKIIASCPVVATYLERYPEYKKLLQPSA